MGAALEWAQRRLQGRHSTARPCAIGRAVTQSHSGHINTTGQLRVHCQCHRPTSHGNRPTSSPRTLSINTPVLRSAHPELLRVLWLLEAISPPILNGIGRYKALRVQERLYCAPRVRFAPLGVAAPSWIPRAGSASGSLARRSGVLPRSLARWARCARIIHQWGGFGRWWRGVCVARSWRLHGVGPQDWIRGGAAPCTQVRSWRGHSVARLHHVHNTRHSI